jgi:hypothetical protein
MSKPIFIVRMPKTFPYEELAKVQSNLDQKLDDYHVLICKDSFHGEEISFECYNAPHTEMEFEELKKRILALVEDGKSESGSPS